MEVPRWRRDSGCRTMTIEHAMLDEAPSYRATGLADRLSGGPVGILCCAGPALPAVFGIAVGAYAVRYWDTTWAGDPGVRPPSIETITFYTRPATPGRLSVQRRAALAAGSARGIPLHEVDIWDDRAAAATVRGYAGGNETVPTVVVGATALVKGVAAVRAALADQEPHLGPAARVRSPAVAALRASVAPIVHSVYGRCSRCWPRRRCR